MRMQNSFDIAQARKREGEIHVAPFKANPLEPQQTLAWVEKKPRTTHGQGKP